MSKIVHFEIPVDDPDRAIAFYAQALGWQVQRYGEQPYWLVTAGFEEEAGANGALVPRDDAHASPVLVAGVSNLDETVRLAARCGGEVIQGKLPVPGVGWSAYVRDPEGNVIGLFEPDAEAAGHR